MEAIGGFAADRAEQPGARRFASAQSPGPASIGATALQSVPAGMDAVDHALAVLESEAITAEDTALWSFGRSADFADRVERLSRRVEHLQVVAAGAVARSRTAALTAAAAPLVPDAVPVPDADPNADGSRNTVDFLRTRLGISACEARRRLTLADSILPRAGFGGQQLPPRYGELAAAVSTAQISSRAATTITLALDRARHFTTPARTAAMEHELTQTAIDNDADFVTRVARHWAEAIDQDGPEPSEPALRQIQGAFIRRPKHGLHHLEIFATPEQFETLTTAMNTATNPRTTTPNTDGNGGGGDDGNGGHGDGGQGAGGANGNGGGAADPDAVLARWDVPGVPEIDLDQRSQGQKRLDGLVGACQTALTTDALPANGGHRPQILVTIDYRDLLARVEQWLGQPSTASLQGALDAQWAQGAQHLQPASAGPINAGSTGDGTALFAFSGPVNPATIRKIACDADIIPVVLGTGGRILDVGRASRIFPPHIRKAIMARDQGCAFPQCTMPAPWCEAHHITYWSRGGPTSTGNGVLLCSYHHHLIHKENWTIEVTNEVPWFKPPPELDPGRKPRRNQYFRSRPHRD
ncbi:HNH endonuclease signature motif containing protein [Arthrobacter globiformis]|uniref:HNH endonuclease signature motif containing protein n=1 Tax=Arthrobacter globiformis TaxID=1665 RepID=UPI000B41E540|nr:HNH endonuclease signature motif containing protein [Arthrobacter globiformis]